jgi:anti-anti-sigma regulatory factor
VISEQINVAKKGALSEPAIVQAGDYINKLTGEQIEYECRRKIDEGYREIVVSFAETEIVNSIGISILLDIVDTASRKGATVAFRDVNENTIQLFDMLGVTKHVTIL